MSPNQALEEALRRGLEDYEKDPSGKGKSPQAWAFSRVVTLAKKSQGSKDKDLFGFIPNPPPPRISENPATLEFWNDCMDKINARMNNAGLKPLKRKMCSIVSYENSKNPRVFAHTNHRKQTICICPQFLLLPRPFIFGILAHEAGHEAAFQAWGNYQEEAADVAAFELLGFNIRYQTDALLQTVEEL